MRRVADCKLANAALIELLHEAVGQRLRHALFVQLAAHDHRGHTSRTHVVHDRARSPFWLAILRGTIVTPKRILQPFGQLHLLPLVERANPLMRILDATLPPGHISVAVKALRTALPRAAHEPTVHKQHILVDEAELAKLEKLAHLPTRAHALEDGLRHLALT
eukprot:514424-Prymnesium_polylepis.4